MKIKINKTDLHNILQTIFLIIIAFFISLFLKKYIFINAIIPSGSMENTIMTKDYLIGSKLSYRFNDPERGDIIIFKYPDDESQKFIKRIIGLPGEIVEIKDNKIYINGEELQEDYLKEEWIKNNTGYKFTVPSNSYLVLGDNRNNSLDARFWENTYVAREKIIAKAKFIYFPHFKILD